MKGINPLAVAVVAGIAAIAVPLVGSDYAVSFSIQLLIFLVLAYSWNWIGGYTGYTHFGQVGFFGIGAYVGSLLNFHWGVPWYLAAIAAALAGAATAVPLGGAMLRLKGPFFAIGMFGLARVLEAFALGFDSITGGGTGIYLKPISDLKPIYYVVATVAMIMLLLTWKLDNSRLGLKLLSIREDEDAAESLGIPTTRLKIATFVASAVAPAAMGSLYAVYLGFIDPPTAFAPNIELTTIAMVLLGGMGTVLGPLRRRTCAFDRQRGAVGELSANLSRLRRCHRPSRRAVHAAGHCQSRHEKRMARRRTAIVSPVGRGRRTGAVMSESILAVENVSKRFAGRIALDSVSIDVAPGSITGMIGPNGSGKSTLFNIIAGTLRPDAGRVLVRGQNIGSASAAEICGLGVARTFQISRLFAEMTVLENLVAVARGRDDRAAIALALELLEFLEIADIADRWGSELSYGQRKLVEIARALMLQPKIMLLDEPFAGVNPRLQNRIVEHLRTLCARGITVFFIDHEMRIVLGECDLVYVLAEGQLIARGDPQSVRNDAKVLQAYF